MLKNLDKKQKTELIIIAIGVIFLVVLLISRFNNPNKKKVSVPVSTGQQGLSSSIYLEPNDTPSLLAKGTWGRDPFFFDTVISGKTENLSEFVLNGIMWDKDNPYAVINNEVVRLGDKIGDKTVVEINEKNVVLEQDGQRHTLELNVL